MTAPIRRPRLADLPELATRTGIFGSSRHAEIGGSVCFGIVITTVMATQVNAVADDR